MNIDKTYIKKLFPKRKPNSHKGDFGKLLVIGGSKQYSGAPAFVGLAALRAGVDLVKIIAPERAANIIAGFSPDLITWPLRTDFLTAWHIPEIQKFIKEYEPDAIVIGNGAGKNPKTLDFFNRFIKTIEVPCVIDADALHAVAKNPKILKKNFILVPHAIEFQILSGTKPSLKIKTRKEQVQNLAKKLGVTVLLKGRIDVISNGEEIALNNTGNPFMTVGGTGDTLAGICGALFARKINPLLSACAAAYINGLAGDLAAKEFGESLTATDIINFIPKIMK